MTNLRQRRATREEKIKFELARCMKNQIVQSPSGILTINGVEFADVEIEWQVSRRSNKRADIVILRPGNHAIFVIETNKSATSGKNVNLFSPFALSVIEQAKEYANELKVRYYATFNGNYFVVFKVVNPKAPIDEPIFSLEVTNYNEFTANILKIIARIIKNKIKPIITEDLYSKQLKSYFDLIYPQYLANLMERIKIEKNKKKSDFYNTLKYKMEKSDRSIEKEKDLVKIAKEATYILIDKLLFYQLLSKTPGYHLTPLQSIAHKPNFSAELRYLFQSVVDEINFGPIFSSGELFTSDINDNIKDISQYNDKYDISLEEFKDDIIDFIILLQKMNLHKFDATQLGYFFERIIPIDERRELGQYYTPKPVIELINRLTIKSHNVKIFDPACGSGGFLLGAYNILKKLKDQNGIQYNHIALLKQLTGNDIRRFPTHLSSISLAIQELQLLTHEVEILNEDFFNIYGKSFKRFTTKVSTADGVKTKEAVIISDDYDVIVMNPPYLRQERIDKELITGHLDLKPLKSILDKDPSVEMSGQSDIYCYFITHAWDFLKEGGRVGAILSDRWLDTKYGEKFQKVLLRLYKIEAVLSFDRQAFDEPLIGSVIIILEKCSQEQQRTKNIIKFFRLKAKKSIKEIINILENPNTNAEVDNQDYRFYLIQQKTLNDISKWSIFLFYNLELFCLLKYAKSLINIQKYCDIKRGVTSGANDFFFRKYNELTPDLIKYFSPLIKSLGQVDKIQFNEPEPEWGILDLKNIMEPLLKGYEIDFKKKLEEEDKFLNKKKYVADFLKENHKALYKYIKKGKTNGFVNRETVQSREFWFYLGDLDSYEICLSMFYWRVFVSPIQSETKYYISDQLTYIILKNKKYLKLMGAWLNSNLITFFLEILSRKAKGERLDRLQLKIYEAKNLPCLDFELMKDNEINAIETCWSELMKLDLNVNLRNDKPSKKDLKILNKWMEKKKDLDLLFLKFLFPVEFLKNINFENEIHENLFMKKCYKFYKIITTQLRIQYSESNYDDFLKHILHLILESNKNMLLFREKGGKEQQEELVELEKTIIEGAKFMDA